MKNKFSILAGVFCGIISLLIFPEIFQKFIALLFGVESNLSFNSIIPIVTFNGSSVTSLTAILITGFAPVIYIIIICETGSFILGKTYAGFYRYATIMFLLINIGFLLFFIFFNSADLILELNIGSDWRVMIAKAGITGYEYLLYIFLIIIIMAGYLNIVTRRIIKYIQVQEQKNDIIKR